MNFHSVNTLSQTQAREEICRVGLSLFQRGYVHATAGNISMRVGDGFLITPTDACLGNLEPSQLGLAQSQWHANQWRAEPVKPLRYIDKFMKLLTMTTGSLPAQCVIHTHSTYCVSLSLNAQGPELLARHHALLCHEGWPCALDSLFQAW
jgi:3-dehydro-4-phosphotetronate decarboxylase